MKTHHYLLAAGAVALVAFLATRRPSSSTSAAMARNAAVSARFRQQLWSEVEPDFWA